MPSLPTCMSQNSAFPSAMASCRSRTKSERFGGSGTGTVFREGGGGGSADSLRVLCGRRSAKIAAQNTLAKIPFLWRKIVSSDELGGNLSHSHHRHKRRTSVEIRSRKVLKPSRTTSGCQRTVP